MLFFGLFLCFLLKHLDNPTLLIGGSATVCLLFAQFLILKGMHMAASQSVKVLEDYVGDETPLPLFQDPRTGEWVVRSELSDNNNGMMAAAGNTSPFSCCIRMLCCCYAFSCPCCWLRGLNDGDGGGDGVQEEGEDAPVLGARQTNEEVAVVPNIYNAVPTVSTNLLLGTKMSSDGKSKYSC
jgi:hypothetical protein